MVLIQLYLYCGCRPTKKNDLGIGGSSAASLSFLKRMRAVLDVDQSLELKGSHSSKLR